MLMHRISGLNLVFGDSYALKLAASVFAAAANVYGTVSACAMPLPLKRL